MTKIFKLTLGAAVVLFLAAYLFNHVDSWVGIAFIVAVAYFAFRLIDKEIDKNK
jgi:Ca2+/Na+ antiporter